MPFIETKGAASAQGFGLFGFVNKDGVAGIFALGGTTGCNSTIRNKYTYATDSSTACGVGAASVASSEGAAAGNNTRGIFALGSTNSGMSNTRNKYTYASDTSTASGVATSTKPSNLGSAAGNSTRGIFALGNRCCCGVPDNGSQTREKYTYACCTSTASGVGLASAASKGGSAAGNSTRGIFALGSNSSNILLNTRNKYTYACDTSTASGVGTASRASQSGSAAGNSTRGIFALGNAQFCTPDLSDIRNKYTYACDTSTASGVGTASANSQSGAATGNSTRGIFALGSINIGKTAVRNKYTYASCTSTACGVASASAASRQGSGASPIACVNI